MKYRAHLSAVLAAALLAAGCASTTTGSVASGGSARSQLMNRSNSTRWREWSTSVMPRQ